MSDPVEVRKKRWRWIAGLAVAIVVAGGAWYKYRTRPAARDAILIAVERLPSAADGLPAGWDARPWASADTAVSEQGRAVRVGALLVDLEVAVRSKGDQIAPIAREIVGNLSELPATAPIIAFLNEAAMRPTMASDDMTFRLTRVRNAARRLLDKDLIAVGAWAEGGRLAALGGASYPKIGQNVVNRAASAASSDEVRSALEQLAGVGGAAQTADSTYARVLNRLGR
ncbi:MAG: hypothetical protein MNPFHGCM_01166 [Gemmatimonadaceae bacterium]|nr:hypothetical protein [Gemmatimonadaceae bacterium]